MNLREYLATEEIKDKEFIFILNESTGRHIATAKCLPSEVRNTMYLNAQVKDIDGSADERKVYLVTYPLPYNLTSLD